MTTLPTFQSQLDEIAAAEQGHGWLSVCEDHGRFLVLTRQFITALSRFLRTLGPGPILEVCAGGGELAESICRAGVDIVATDANPPGDSERIGEPAPLAPLAGRGAIPEAAPLAPLAGRRAIPEAAPLAPLAGRRAIPEAAPLAPLAGRGAGGEGFSDKLLAVERASAQEALRRYRPAVVLGCFVPIDSGVDELVMRSPSVRHYVVLAARIGGLLGSAPLWHDANWTAEPLAEVTRWMLTRHDTWTGTPGRSILRHGEAWHLRRRGWHTSF